MHSFPAGSDQRVGKGTVPLGQHRVSEPHSCRETVLESALPASHSVTWAVHLSDLVILSAAKLLLLLQGYLSIWYPILPG